jgi:hypothetical protein
MLLGRSTHILNTPLYPYLPSRNGKYLTKVEHKPATSICTKTFQGRVSFQSLVITYQTTWNRVLEQSNLHSQYYEHFIPHIHQQVISFSARKKNVFTAWSIMEEGPAVEDKDWEALITVPFSWIRWTKHDKKTKNYRKQNLFNCQ